MSSLVSTVIRQDREDKAITTVHLPEVSGEGQEKASHKMQDRGESIGNGKNGVFFDTSVPQPTSPSHQVSKLYRGVGGGEGCRGMTSEDAAQANCCLGHTLCNNT